MYNMWNRSYISCVQYHLSFEGMRFDSLVIPTGCHKGTQYWERLQQCWLLFPGVYTISLLSYSARLHPTTLCPSALTFHWKVVPKPCATKMRNLHLTSGLTISMPTISPWILLLALLHTLNHSLSVTCSSSPADFYGLSCHSAFLCALDLLWGHSLSVFWFRTDLPRSYPFVKSPVPQVPSEFTSLVLVWA